MLGTNLVCTKQETKSRIHKALGYSDMLDKMFVNKIIYLNSNVLGLLISIESINSW